MDVRRIPWWQGTCGTYGADSVGNLSIELCGRGAREEEKQSTFGQRGARTGRRSPGASRSSRLIGSSTPFEAAPPSSLVPIF